MHFHLLVEGRSDKTALEIILPKILGPPNRPHSWKIYPYRGIGCLPSNPSDLPDPKNRTLLHNLPSLLRGFGNCTTEDQAIIVVVDLDTKDCLAFKKELVGLLDYCRKKPKCLFRIAIEEMEAWFLGDRPAILKAYPKAKEKVLNKYKQDSICNTWELLADAVYKGGSAALEKVGYPTVGVAKERWAAHIAPGMDVENNSSKSFNIFRAGMLKLAGFLD